MATALQREHLAGLMDFLVQHEPLVHYREQRPMRTRRLREQGIADTFDHHGTITMDCSESVTLLCRLAGLADPNGHNYDGTGFTGTLLAHLPHYTDPKAAGVGALVVFGPGSGEHVCMVRHPGADPVLFSHGQEAGPIYVRLSAERKAHHAPVTFLSIARL